MKAEKILQILDEQVDKFYERPEADISPDEIGEMMGDMAYKLVRAAAEEVRNEKT